MTVCLKIIKKKLISQQFFFLHLPPISGYTEFASSCFIVYMMIQEIFLTPVLCIGMLEGRASSLNGKNDASQEMENVKGLHHNGEVEGFRNKIQKKL